MPITEGGQDVPVKITGSSTFGRYPTVSPSRTYNMFITTAQEGEEEWLVNFAGYASVNTLLSTAAPGRGIFHSIRGGFLIVVVGTAVYRLNSAAGTPIPIGDLGTSTGEVVIDENLNSQICIVDGSTVAYIYNYDSAATTAFGTVTFSGNPSGLTFIPNYVTYQNEFFIFGNGASDSSGNLWFVYAS